MAAARGGARRISGLRRVGLGGRDWEEGWGGGGRVVLRRIEDRVRRGICFRKRLAGLEKKVEELAVLCDAHVGFVVLSCSGDDANPHHFAAPATYAPFLSLPLPLLPPNLLG
uniref:MADS-box domain-containing protein n=1 Tax=Oryza rufipogon TaxID=4529 RepID=A0A0E0P8A4_ORYRU